MTKLGAILLLLLAGLLEDLRQLWREIRSDISSHGGSP